MITMAGTMRLDDHLGALCTMPNIRLKLLAGRIDEHDRKQEVEQLYYKAILAEISAKYITYRPKHPELSASE